MSSDPRNAKQTPHCGSEQGLRHGSRWRREAGITEGLVLVGLGVEAEYSGKRVGGSIVLVSKLPSPANALAAADAVGLPSAAEGPLA